MLYLCFLFLAVFAQAVTRPALKYGYGDLEPVISEKLMHLHYDKHFKSYTDTINSVLEYLPPTNKNLPSMLSDLDSVPEEVRPTVQKHGGGYVNHAMFFANIRPPTEANAPAEAFEQVLKAQFGSFDMFKVLFGGSAAKLFGSGWTWLVMDPKTFELSIITTANQDSPLSSGLVPLLTLDVWEHAYYPDYENRRKDWIHAWWQIVNWDYVESGYKFALTQATKQEL